ncbi:ABC transporter permease subunit [Shimazuella kribbensis]|uniref:ABC transporter permease subunit n=1 Tax=Shimazuella kribbensis TaxID=139808 RepID=UPI0003FE035F|nr:ABC transporter permease subunit [Shimazuella kribbensis]
MIGALYRTMIKTNGKLMLYMGLGSFVIMAAYVALFPTIANQNMDQLLKSMPEGLLKAFNLSDGLNTLNGFLVAEFYSMIYLILLIVYSVLTANHLVSRLVDRGSMAYLIATPNSRLRVITTQMLFSLTGLVFISVCIVLGALVSDAWLIDTSMLEMDRFLQINVIGCLTFAVICAYSFLFSCLFNDERRALSISASITIIFLILDIVGKVSEDLDWLRNFTLFHAFDPAKISDGTVKVLPLSIGLAGASIFLFVLSAIIFKRKDLPI